MSKFHVEVSKQAERQISKLPKRDKQRVLEAIISLSNDPRPHGYKKLEYHTEYFRFRVGNYRIIYQIQNNMLFVFVVEEKSAMSQLTSWLSLRNYRSFLDA